MEGTEDKPIERRNGFLLPSLIQEHITVLDLSNKNIKIIDENLSLPINLTELNLSNNKLKDVPVSVLKLEHIKMLNLSYNFIQIFDETPNFCQTIQVLNISNNYLCGPPYWVWSEAPSNLLEINLSCNNDITKSLTSEYYEELLGYTSVVTNVIIFNCKLYNHMKLLETFPLAKSLVLGTSDISFYSQNNIEEVPCNGLEKCCDIEYLNLSNTNIYNVNINIDIYKNLKEIDLSYNKINQLPNEFCMLENLVTCILSYNNIFALPEMFCKLSKLENLSIDRNDLYMLPTNFISELTQLKILDLYDNCLCEVPYGIENLHEVDLARNYFEEPTDEEYLEKRKVIRLNCEIRYDGSKPEDIQTESEHSKDLTDDDTLWSNQYNNEDIEERSLSSPEDWDSDDYWIPHTFRLSTAPQSPWLFYIKQKLKEGNFCPIDAHSVPIADQVGYQKICYPKIEYESDGQFEDYSGDDS